MQTIAAISTPAGAGAIAIIRMSGDDALAIAARLFSCSELGDFSQAEPRKMYLGTINAGEYADRCLAVRFKAPKTYTGEEIVEFHCHGGARLAREVLAACVACGARVADKGEFTKRAFLAGKLALSDAEAVIDMINAESGAALKASYRMLTGALADEIKAFSDRLLDACASLEASFDYPEEMEDESVFDAKGAVADALEHVEKLLATARTGAMVRDGIDVAIVGAIVTDIAGTTRDSLEERIEKDGVAINLIDTAGIRDTDDEVEKMGVERSYRAAKSADVVLFVSDATRELCDEERRILKDIPDGAKVVTVLNKSDLPHSPRGGAVHVSAKTGEGIEALKATIAALVTSGEVDASGNIITEERHKEALERAKAALLSAKAALDGAMPIECAALDIKQAYSALGEITGETADEAVIDRVFSKFCVGK